MHKLCDASGNSETNLKTQLEKIAGRGKVYILGLGNTDRADDGAGVLVALALKRLFPLYSYSEHDGIEETVLDISEKSGNLTVFFVDTADLKKEPGTIKLVEKEKIRNTEITTHRVAVALMASILERAGMRSAVICIQPETLEFRAKVSRRVQESIEELVRILAELMKSRT